METLVVNFFWEGAPKVSGGAWKTSLPSELLLRTGAVYLSKLLLCYYGKTYITYITWSLSFYKRCLLLFLFVCTCVCLCSLCDVCVGGTFSDQKKVLDPLELELQVIVSCLTWALGTKLGPSGRTASALILTTKSSQPPPGPSLLWRQSFMYPRLASNSLCIRGWLELLILLPLLPECWDCWHALPCPIYIVLGMGSRA